MARLRNNRRDKDKGAGEVDVTTFLNLMVVLIPFLLVTAVFSRITIQELNMPQQAAGGEKPDKPLVTIEVIVREKVLEVTDGDKITNTFKKVEDQHDIKSLSAVMRALKERYQEKNDATILVEPDVPYEDVIRVMDAVKVAELEIPGQDGAEPAGLERVVLFPRLSLGDAP